MDPPWLAGRSEYCGVLRAFVPGRGVDDAVVELDEPIRVEGIDRRYALLRLRYEDADWIDREVVHVVFYADVPVAGAEPWAAGPRGAWMESHAEYERVDSPRP